MKLRSPCPWGLVASICQARGSGPFLCFFGCIVRIGAWLSGVQRLDYDDHSHHHHLLSSSSSSSSLSFSSSSSSLVVLGNLIMQLFSCQDLSQEFGCQNYCQVKTSRIYLSVATILGSKPPDGSFMSKQCSDQNLQNPLLAEFSCCNYFRVKTHGWIVSRTSRFLTCLNRSFLSSSVADFMLSTAFVMNSFLRDFLQPFCIFSSLRWLCSLMSLSFCMDFLHPFELLLFPDCSCGRS